MKVVENTYDYDLRSVQEVRDLTRLGKIASDQLASYTEEQVNAIVSNMVKVAEENAQILADMAVHETGFGNSKDKAIKNHLASGVLYEAIKDMKTVGIIDDDPVTRVIQVADPVGLLMGIIPSTNPTSTTIFKAIIAIKARNGIVFSPHPSAMACTQKAASLMATAAVAAGAPQNIISCMSLISLEGTNELMRRDEIKMIIATGGPGMVKAAYSSGKPALGVGAGNSPAYIERTAKVDQAVRNIIASKTFDYGTICASEQSIIVEECNRDAVVAAFTRYGGYFMNKEETEKVCALLFKNGGHVMNAKFVGRSPEVIAEGAGISIPAGTKVLIGEQTGVGAGNPLSYEKLTTVLGFYTVKDKQEACRLCVDLLQNGLGHTLSLHTEDPAIVREFSVKQASRILVNTGSTQGGTGLSTGLLPSFTLGCGSWGGSSISENVGPQHLINIKKIAYGIVDITGEEELLPAAGQESVPGALEHSSLPKAVGQESVPGALEHSSLPKAATANVVSAAQVPSCNGVDILKIAPDWFAAGTGDSAEASTCAAAVAAVASDMSEKPITKDDLTGIIATMQNMIKGE